MSKTNKTNDLPAPLSLTLEEASKVAAGSSGILLSGVESWWWKGLAPITALDKSIQVVTPISVAVGPLVTH